MKIGFVGLGNIGLPMASCIQAGGYEMKVHDLVKSRANRLLDKGAIWAPTIADICTGSQLIITSLPGPVEIQSIYSGENGLAQCLESGQIWVEMSTTDEQRLRSYSKTLGQKGVKMLEATVTCGVDNAWNGNLTLLVGGKSSDLERCRPILARVASNIIHVGDLGHATIAKLITNMLAFIHEGALAEALLLGQKSGLDPEKLLNGIQASYGGSFVADVDGPKVIKGNYNCDFALDLARKDMKLTAELANRVNTEFSWGRMSCSELDSAIEKYGNKGDVLSVFRKLEMDI